VPAETRSTGLARTTLPSLLAGLLACVVAFKLRTIPVSTDPWHYVQAGLTFPEPSWLLVGLTRYGMVLPMIPVARLFHESELSFYLTPVLITGVLVASLHWLTARFYGQVAAAAAAVLLMANSLVLVNASRMYPDIYAVAMTAVAVMFAVAARDRWRRTEHVDVRLVTLLVLTGSAVGLSWWMRETAVFGWPVVAAVLLWRGGPPLRVSLPAAAGAALAFLVLELGIGQWAFGDPWVRFKALGGADLAKTTNPADLPYLGQSRLTYLETIPHGMLAYADGWWMIAMGTVAILGGLLFPRKVGLFAGWFVLVLLAFVAIGGALRPTTPNIRLDVGRYWLAFLPPMIVAAVGTVATAVRLAADRPPARTLRAPYRTALGTLLAVALVTGPVVASTRQVSISESYVVTNHGVMSAFRTWLHAHDRDVHRVLTDASSVRILPVYERSFTGRRMARARFVSLNRPYHARPGDYVVLFSAYDYTCGFCHTPINTWLTRHPGRLDGWTKVWQSPGRTFVVYRVPGRQGGRG
jgi:hypothetical protein